MSYTPKYPGGWVNDPEAPSPLPGETPVNAEVLDAFDVGLVEAHEALEGRLSDEVLSGTYATPEQVGRNFVAGASAKKSYALPTDEHFIPASAFRSSSATVTAPFQDSGPSVSANPWPGFVCVGGAGVGSSKLSTVFKLPQGWGTEMIQMDVAVWWLNMHATEVGSVGWKMNYSTLTPMGALNGAVTLSGPFVAPPAYGQWVVQNTLVYPGIDLLADSVIRLDIARLGPAVTQDTLRADVLFLGATVSKSRVGTKGIWERS